MNDYPGEEVEKKLRELPREKRGSVLYYLLGYMQSALILQRQMRKDGFTAFREGLNMALDEFGEKTEVKDAVSIKV